MIKILILNYSRHSDLLHMSYYIKDCFESELPNSKVKIVASQRLYDNVQIKCDLAESTWHLLKLLITEKPDLLYITAPSITSFTSIVYQSIFTRKKLVVHLHRFDYSSYSFLKSIILFSYNKIVTRLSTFCIVHAKDLALKNKKYKYAIIPIYKKPQAFSTTTNNFYKKNILFFGRIDRNKGLERIYELAVNMKDCFFHIYGELIDSSLSHVLKKISNMSNCLVVSRRINEEELFSIFSNKDFVILPYTDGTQSGVPTLSASYGVPVLTTDFGDVCSTINFFRCGICRPYDLEEWQNIIRFTNWGVLRNKISINEIEIRKTYNDIISNLKFIF